MSTPEVKITVVATDKASETFDAVVDSAEKIGPALDEATEAAEKLGPALVDVTTPATNVKPALDDAGTSAVNLAPNLDTATASIGSMGSAFDEVKPHLGGVLASGMDLMRDSAIGFAVAVGTTGVVAALAVAGSAVVKFVSQIGGGSGLSEELTKSREDANELQLAISDLAGSLADARLGQSLGSNEIDVAIQDISRYIEIASQLQPLTSGFASFGVPDEFKSDVREITALAEEYGLTWEQFAGPSSEATEKLKDLEEVQQLYNDAVSQSGPGQDKARESAAAGFQQWKDGTITLDQFRDHLQWVNDTYETNFNQVALAEAALAQYSKTASDAAISVGLLNDTIEVLNAAGLQTPAALAALNLVGSALDSTFNIVVGGTNKLASSSQAVADWAAGLFEVDESQSSALSRLFDEKIIDITQYNNALDANNRIQSANNDIQQDLLAIQANQAPLLADLTEQQAAYIDSLAGLSAEQQLVALGYMDAAESAKAMELANLAAAAASGELGDTGEATAAKIITAAAQADPVMKAMLEDMNLITVDKEGNIKVNFPNATSLADNVDALTASIDALTLALGGVPPDVNTNVNVNDNASWQVENIKSQMANLNGTSATVTVNYISNTVGGAPAGSLIGGNRDGGLVRYANGGLVPAHLAEAGPELLRFANGGQAVVPNPGIYAVEPGTSVLPAPATRAVLADAARASGSGEQHNYYGPVTQQITLDNSSFARRRAAIASIRG